MKSIFVSYVFEDAKYVQKLRKWAQEKRLGDNIAIVTADDEKEFGGTKAIRRYISPKMNGAAAVIFLTGDNNHNHDWIEYEAVNALCKKKPIIVLRISHTHGALPPSLRNKGYTEVTFEPDAIKRAIAEAKAK